MADIGLLFQIAIIGIIASVLHSLLRQAGKEEFGHAVTLIGVVLIMVKVIYEIAQLFAAIRTMFQF